MLTGKMLIKLTAAVKKANSLHIKPMKAIKPQRTAVSFGFIAVPKKKRTKNGDTKRYKKH
jgi:hypothetical protein